MRVGVACILLFAAAPLSAQSPAPATSPGAEALARARTAWQNGDWDKAEPLYKEAILKGGLSPTDVLDAYVHLASARTVIGKLKPAVEAFRSAASIDPTFTVPPEAGRRARQIGEQAKHEKKKLGAITLNGSAPSSVKAGESFGIDATLDDPHVKLVTKVTVSVKDPLSGKSFDAETAPAASMHFDVPTSVTLPSATLVVRFDALDGHKNRLASSESRVQVEALPTPKIADAPLPHADRPREREREKEKAKSGGFWSTAWPYVLGGVALAAGGTATYFILRPTDDVMLGGPRATTVH